MSTLQTDGPQVDRSPLETGKEMGPDDANDNARSLRRIKAALLTGGGDKPYALGLASALVAQGIMLDFIGSDEVDSPELHQTPQVTFLNLRGDQRRDVDRARKVLRVLAYYVRLMLYAAKARPKVFHILWNNKFECFDRTALMLYYKLLGRKIVFTAHNVNAGERDGNDSVLNRLTLRIQYRWADHVFVHTKRMKDELAVEFGVPAGKVSVIPFGINNTVPRSELSPLEAKRMLGIDRGVKSILFFGNIAPYKGLEYLISAFAELAATCTDYRLIIAGRPKDCEEYWRGIQSSIARSGIREHILERIEYIPDEQTELYFKASDVLVLPYSHIFQSGVLFLAYSFGLPVIAADVGSMREDVVEGKTGFVFRPRDSADLARVIRTYFSSELFQDLETRRPTIQAYANDRYSWSKVGAITTEVYSQLVGI
jgi:D-inositol-3-phosphate glycosyltransferase